MSVTNPERVVTKQDLADFYTEIFPYLGGSAASGFTPVGTVIAVFAETAPTNYLVCDGTAYNKADYPELAAHLLALTTHSQYEVSGDSTKFKVPDLRGEFLRGTGTNSHTNQGSGANVGVHQDATEIPYIESNATQLRSSGVNVKNHERGQLISTTGAQFKYATGTTFDYVYQSYTSRPTNTSVLFCIAVKNIVMGGGSSMNYSTDEQLIGNWLGKPLYQKVYTNLTTGNGYKIESPVLLDDTISFDIAILDNGMSFFKPSSDLTCPVNAAWYTGGTQLIEIGCQLYVDANHKLYYYVQNAAASGSQAWVDKPMTLVVRYTKTTD